MHVDPYNLDFPTQLTSTINKEGRKKLTNLLHEDRDVLAFSYDELKGYREDVMEHTIPLKDENAKPFHQKLR